MGIECKARLNSVAIGVAELACDTAKCPLQTKRLLYVEDKSGLLSPADQRASLEKRADVLAGMVCLVKGQERPKPTYAPIAPQAPVLPKR